MKWRRMVKDGEVEATPYTSTVASTSTPSTQCASYGGPDGHSVDYPRKNTIAYIIAEKIVPD